MPLDSQEKNPWVKAAQEQVDRVGQRSSSTLVSRIIEEQYNYVRAPGGPHPPPYTNDHPEDLEAAIELAADTIKAVADWIAGEECNPRGFGPDPSVQYVIDKLRKEAGVCTRCGRCG